jgi:hypothetical protein
MKDLRGRSRQMRRMIRWAVLTGAFCLVTQGSPAWAEGAEEPMQLFMPDGQLKSHLIQVFVNRELTSDANPEIRLIGSHVLREEHPGMDESYRPAVVAPHQRWMQEVEGEKVEFTGTLLLFDLCHFPVPLYQPMTRVTPVLAWKEGGEERTVVGAHEVYLAQIVGAFGWALSLIVILAGFIAILARTRMDKALYLFCGPDAGMSLWRTQIAAWTLAIGSMVVGYGFIRLEIPDIPESLVALMGLSLATGGIRYIQVKDFEEAARKQRATALKGWPTWSSLITDKTGPGGTEELSIAKAQMVFWTGLMLALFVTKSLLDGRLWDVPWEMVALMGMSQAGYVSGKLVPQKAAGA